MKRTIIYSALLLALNWSAKAQEEFRQKVNGDISATRLEISNLSSRLEIKGHNSDEIVISAAGYKGLPEKAKGLKPLSAFGEDNTSMGLYLNQSGAQIELAGATRAAYEAKYTIMVPQNLKLKINSEHWNAYPINVEGLQNDIEIKANSSDVKLLNISGPVVLTTLNGGVEITYSGISQSGPSSISSTNGDIDITMPGSSKADFKLSSLNGEIYSNLNITTDAESRKNLQRIAGGMKVNGTLNGGGAQISIDALNGNVYLRKEE